MHLYTKYKNSNIYKSIVLSLIVVFTITIVSSGYAQENSEKKLKEGIKLYENAEFDLAIEMLTGCIEKDDLTTEQKTLAYKYLAQAYMARELRNQAVEAVEKLLKLVPNYKPDPVRDRRQFIELVEEVKVKVEQDQKVQKEKPTITPKEKSKRKKWLLIGGGAVAVGGIALFAILSGGDGDGKKTLPYPPDLP